MGRQSYSSASNFDLKEFSIDKEKALVGLKDNIVSEFEDLNSEGTKKARNDHFKVTGAKPDEYGDFPPPENKETLNRDEFPLILFIS